MTNTQGHYYYIDKTGKAIGTGEHQKASNEFLN